MTKQDNLYWQVLDRWVEGIIHLFAPQITWLQQARDYQVIQHQLQNPGMNIYENHDFQELSSIPISLTDQVQWLLQPEQEICVSM